MKSIISATLALLIGFSITALPQTKENRNKLNDQTFNIKLTMTSGSRTGWNWLSDHISFKSGKLRSHVMSSRERFDNATIEIVSASDKTISFNATSKNPSGSKIEWKGTINGNTIEGTAEWTNKQGTQTYSFSGASK